MTKIFKPTLLLTLLLSGITSSGYCSFHSGGVGSCGGCHVSKSSNASVTGSLTATDPSSVCLTCHAGTGSANSPSVLSLDGSAHSPGGDFYWLTKSFVWASGSSPAAQHGHNVVALDYGLNSDPNRPRSPGGSYPSSQLSCISCHDPHGTSGDGTSGRAPAISVSGSYGQEAEPGTTRGHYRLLGGAGYNQHGYSFNYPAPVARQNASRPFAESDTSHVDHGFGVSEWCANCHQAILASNHQAGPGKFEHPVDSNVAMSTEIIDRYNTYVSSGDLSGSINTAYLQFVPFDRGTTTLSLLDPTSTRGMDNNSRLNCLTCHRAHASAFGMIGRWDFTASLLSESHPAVGDGGATAADVVNSYYGRDLAAEFGQDQGPFCEKCHDLVGP